MKSDNKIVFVADEIEATGLFLLEEKGYEVVRIYGLKNPELFEYMSKFKVGGKQAGSALIVRTIRTLEKADILSLKKKTDVRLICAASSGYDNIDIQAARRCGIHVLSCPDSTYVSAAEHTIALLMAITKNLLPAGNDMKSGIFDFKRYSNEELSGKTIGIIGVGRVGSSVAKVARALGMSVIGNDIDRKLISKYKWIDFVSLKKLLTVSDIVTVHTPFDETTNNLINAENMKLLKTSSILLNCARGGIVNEKALLDVLKKGRIHYAGLDVFENEPEFDKKFALSERTILTPHLAGKTRQSRVKVSTQLARRIMKFYGGKGKSICIC